MSLNQELGKVFEQFAEILELKGDLRFKIIAYQKAASAISELTEDIGEIYKSKGVEGLDGIDGVGPGIAGKIEEYIKTGRVKELERLKKNFPAIEVGMMNIPGIGPKTARKLYEAFKPTSIDDLSTKLTKKGGEYFQEKTLENILDGIKIFKGFGDRMFIDRATAISDEIVSFLKRRGNGSDITAVGSIRRAKETVGDIDIVASSPEPSKLIKDFANIKGFKEIVNQGDTKASAINNDGVRVDLEVLPKESYGTLLLHFTGSKQHNVDLRTFGLTKGLSISEHAVKETKTGKIHKFSKEEDVYAFLGLDFIAPELREGKGEIEAARDKKLPVLVELKDIKGDLHIHSNFSDGSSTISDIADRAVKLGYQYIAISDHAVDLAAARGLSEERFYAREKEISKIRKRCPELSIFSSCEVNIRSDGSLDLSDKLLSEFDIVTASIHTSFKMNQKEMTDRLIKAIKNKNVDIIGHPTGRILNRREGYELEWSRVFDACIRHKTALEISASPYRLDIYDSIIQEAKKRGVQMVVSTDAHSVEQMSNMRFGVGMARRGWCESNDLLNTMSIGKLKQWLARI